MRTLVVSNYDTNIKFLICTYTRLAFLLNKTIGKKNTFKVVFVTLKKCY